MICEGCRTELDDAAVICSECGARVRSARPGTPDWREQVRETVRRHQEKKRRKLEARDDDARQLSIFPEDAGDPGDDEEKNVRERRAEIRARVEERMARRHVAVERIVDAGELPLGQASLPRRSAAAVARELDSEPLPAPDPRTARLKPLSERSDAVNIADLDHEADDADLADQESSDEGTSSEPLSALGLASVFERVFSGFIDLAFVFLIQLTLFYLTTHLVAQRLGALPRSALGAMGLVGSVLAAGYFLFFWSLSGQTLGKLLMGARVVDRRGSALGFGRAALRLVGTFLAALPLGAGFVGLLTDPERRGWHDRIAGTKVIRG